MKLDERDEHLSRLLGGAIDDVGVRLPDPEPMMRRGGRRRAMVVIASVTSVAVFIGFIGVAAFQFGRDAARPGVGSATPVPAPPEEAPLSFTPAEGWQSEVPPARTSADLVSAWTSNQTIEPSGEACCVDAKELAASLEGDGVVVIATDCCGGMPDPTNPNFPPAELPLPLPDQVSSEWEGYTPGKGRSEILAQVNGRYLQIWIYYGTPDPSDEVRAEAQSALDRLVVEPSGAGSIYTDEQDGFSIGVPAEWSVSPEPINTWLADPHEILAMGTYPLRSGGDAVTDFQLPSRTIGDLGANDMLIWVTESGSEAGFPPRPERFEPSSACDRWSRLCPEPTGRALRSEYEGLTDVRAWWLGFHDSGRGFYVFVGMGERAFDDPARAREPWDVLDSLKVEA